MELWQTLLTAFAGSTIATAAVAFYFDKHRIKFTLAHAERSRASSEVYQAIVAMDVQLVQLCNAWESEEKAALEEAFQNAYHNAEYVLLKNAVFLPRELYRYVININDTGFQIYFELCSSELEGSPPYSEESVKRLRQERGNELSQSILFLQVLMRRELGIPEMKISRYQKSRTIAKTKGHVTNETSALVDLPRFKRFMSGHINELQKRSTFPHSTSSVPQEGAGNESKDKE